MTVRVISDFIRCSHVCTVHVCVLGEECKIMFTKFLLTVHIFIAHVKYRVLTLVREIPLQKWLLISLNQPRKSGTTHILDTDMLSCFFTFLAHWTSKRPLLGSTFPSQHNYHFCQWPVISVLSVSQLLPYQIYCQQFTQCQTSTLILPHD